jgi:hypothetical protein
VMKLRGELRSGAGIRVEYHDRKAHTGLRHLS